VRALAPLHVFAESYWGDLAPGTGLYRPLALLWIGAERALLGEHHAALLAVGVALHAACVVLVHRTLARLLPARIATGAALVAAVHPIAAEAAITVYGQIDVLATGLVIAALRMQIAAQRDVRWIAPAAAAALAALLVKESAIVAPLLAWLVAARLGGTRGAVLAIGAAVATGVGLRFLALGDAALPGAITVSGADTLGGRATLVLVSVGTALRLLVFPAGQTLYYGHLRDPVASGALVESLFVIGFVALAGRLPRGGAARFGAAWLAIALLPVASIVPIGFLAAERALYLPRIGYAVLVAALVCAAFDRLSARRWLPAFGATVALLGVALSWRVAAHWHDPVSLWRSTVAAHPRSPKAHAAYAMALLADAKGPAVPLAEARRHAERCRELNPASAECAAALAAVLERERRASR
jgi:hypothetical protein